jgi:hypothetical protein
MALTKAQALKKVKQLGLKAQDYGWDGKFTSYADQKIGNWTYQYLANALNEPIYQIGQDGKQYVEAYPEGSRDTFTDRPVPAEGPNKQNIIEQIQKVADYAALASAAGAGPTTPSFSSLQQKLQDAWGSAQQAGISADEFNSTFDNYYNNRFPQYVAAQNDTRGGLLGFLDKATPIVTNIAAGVITGGLPLGAQLAVSAASSYAQGAKGEDIIRGIVGTIAANQLGPLTDGKATGIGVVDDFNKAVQAIGNPELQSAIFNAARQGVYATVTEQDIAKNMAAGAIAGAIATNIQKKYNDPALANAAGEYFQARIAGKSDLEAAAAAFSGYATEEQKANAKKAVAEEAFNLPLEQRKALGYMTRDEVAGLTSGEVGSFSQAPSQIAAKEEFKARPGEVGENIIQVTDKDGIVTYQKRITAETPLGNKVGYIIIYDPVLNTFDYEFRTSSETINNSYRPSLTTLNASQEILPPRIIGTQSGQRTQGEDFGEPTARQQTPLSVEEMPTISLLRRVRTGQETRQNETPLQVDVYGGAGFDREGELATQESVAQREPEENQREKQRLITESTQDTPQEEPETQRQTNNTVLLGLLGGNMTSAMPRTQRTPNEREAANMQALSQALSVGDPGDALFGSGLGRRRNVWNVESLRLKDELGG